MIKKNLLAKFQERSIDDIPIASVADGTNRTDYHDRHCRATERVKKTWDIGIHIAIDDFGTGSSALGYLKDLPFTS